MRELLTTFIATISLSLAAAAPQEFHAGKAIPQFGKIASVSEAAPLPKNTEFRVVFDVADAVKPGAVNRNLESAARFINLHVEAGVPSENISVAIVLHGSAALDITNNEIYQRKNGVPNGNVSLIEALLANNTRVILCGQTAAFRKLTKKDLVPGVEIAHSAMTAHALLQQRDYTLNPF